jgi:hypothetical protein
MPRLYRVSSRVNFDIYSFAFGELMLLWCMYVCLHSSYVAEVRVPWQMWKLLKQRVVKMTNGGEM